MLDEREFELINIVGKQLGSNQRDLSTHLNLSLGHTNMLIRRLVAKGFIRISQLNKRKVQYLLTSKGLAEKMRKSVKYTLNTINAIGLIRERLRVLLTEYYKSGHRQFEILGESDLIHILESVFQEMGLQDCSIRQIKNIAERSESALLLVCTEHFTPPLEGGHNHWVNLIEELAKHNMAL